jgi:hypothetical protein
MLSLLLLSLLLLGLLLLILMLLSMMLLSLLNLLLSIMSLLLTPSLRPWSRLPGWDHLVALLCWLVEHWNGKSGSPLLVPSTPLTCNVFAYPASSLVA